MKNKKEIKDEIFSLDVSAYDTYISNKGELIANLIAGAPTLRTLVPQFGVKANTIEQLNILTTEVKWSTGDCVTGATDSTVIAPREIEAVRLTDREEMCLDKLDAKLPMIQSAGANNQELPFANLYMDLKVAENSFQLEKLVWRGNTSTGTGNLALVDGYLAIADGETGSLGYYATFSGITSGNAISTIETLINNRTEVMYEMDNVIIWMSQGDFGILSQAIIAAYGISGTGVYLNIGNQNELGYQEMVYPGTNVRIRGTHGLNSNRSIFATNENNLRYGTDLESDRERVDIFFDKYHRALVSEIIFSFGVQYEFPENVLYIKKV